MTRDDDLLILLKHGPMQWARRQTRQGMAGLEKGPSELSGLKKLPATMSSVRQAAKCTQRRETATSSCIGKGARFAIHPR